MRNDKSEKKHLEKQSGKVKPYQEINHAVSENEDLQSRQPTPQPKDFEEIEY
ncbi:hypothetical protein [Lentibacillus cibarius]|uniref:hypothetical protein n=1 Tax=Lentibacillus cibarius TaxID=2583219 RepID=UPI00163D57B5|nr:hypothetical protein [Lentibacillus cibarius]